MTSKCSYANYARRPPRLEALDPCIRPARGGPRVHHFGAAVLFERGSDLLRQSFENFIPGCALPFAFAALARPFQRIKNSFGVLNLIDCGGTLCAIATARSGMKRIALELLNPASGFIDVSEEPASRFTVEADRRNQAVVSFYFFGPALRIVFNPVLPLIDRRIVGKRL